MRAVSLPATCSNRHSSTRVACCANRAKLVPWPSQVAPSGSGRPGQTVSGTPGSYPGLQGGERDGQPVRPIVQLVQHFVGGLLELERGQRWTRIQWQEAWHGRRDRAHIRMEKGRPHALVPLAGSGDTLL